MKRNGLKSLFIISVITLLAFPFNTMATGVFSNYTITSVEKQELNDGVECGWILSYGEDCIPVQICKHSNKKNNVYVVRTDYFEVAYISDKKGFGTGNLKSDYRTIPEELTNQVVNYEEVQNQRVITQSEVDDDTALSLIANYLPNLVNSKYQHILN